MSDVDEEIRVRMQQAHDEFVWDHLFISATGWKAGTLRDNDGLRMASRLGVELQRPAFLDRVIAVLREENPGSRKSGEP